MQLSPNEIRVLGSLIEKEITTPEYYPLSRNALQAAANQRSSRDPVLTLSEEDVLEALQSLEDRGLVTPNRGSRDTAAARVPKYEHRARTLLNLRRDETALLCLLLLRGPQTPGELRSRSDRLHAFDDLAAVIATLDRLAARPPRPDADAPITPDTTGPLVTLLPRHPGSREARYAHLLGDPSAVAPPPADSGLASSQPESLPSLQTELLALRSAIAALEDRIAALEARSSGHTTGE
jgi:uncharacterized protein YceH (UPF0502 family)